VKNISGKEFIKILERKGWQLKRVNGSHHIYMKPGSIIRLSVPVHGNTSLKIGLLNSLIKAAGLINDDFS
jgi:predicted RNA binding protein YcfA (HicA-like mRNA interferase family)